jgi:phosphomannomutase
MSLIVSISGIRGTIGGVPGQGLTPVDIVKFTTGFGRFLTGRSVSEKILVVIGRDARPSGEMVSRIVSGTLMGMGIDVIDLGLSTTPTVELAVTNYNASGGIVITASHNPKQWNALKLLNQEGEFLTSDEGNLVMELSKETSAEYPQVSHTGKYTADQSFIDKHTEMILAMPLVNVKAIRQAGFRVVVDCINSTGALAIPRLLEKLGVTQTDVLFGEMTGDFAHNPEPLPENLSELSASVVRNKAHVGFAVDPDVDRLAIVSEDGEMFGEEYTLVAVADYVLRHKKGNSVSNLSSTAALKEITVKAGGVYYASAVGEVNVVEKMKSVKAVIGGEGNGGVIYPDFHYGRDALAGVALFLSHLATSGKSCSALRMTYPAYFISKNKFNLPDDGDMDSIFDQISMKYAQQPLNRTDGVRIEFGKEWVHLRKSNTEPVIRVYAESDAPGKADVLAKKIILDIREILKLNNGYH